MSLQVTSWHGLKVVLLTTAGGDVCDDAALASADAVVAEMAGVWPLPEALIRAGVPVIAIAAVDAAGAAELIASGVEDVVSPSAGIAEVARAIRFAVARRRGRQPAALTPPGKGAGDVTASERPVENLAAVPAAPEPVKIADLEALGRLAGGVAHSFNNLLQVVGGNAEVLLQELPQDDVHRPSTEAIVAASRRAARLTQRLLAFGGRQTLVPEEIDLGELVADALRALRGRMGPQTRVVTEIPSALPRIEADRSQLAEVLAVLADNAAEAMPDGGMLTITASSCQVDASMLQHQPWLRAGAFVRLEVRDTGVGIDEQLLPHVFEPFFTTQPEWRGSGLGLSSVYGIVRQSGGYIWVDSTRGVGTRVTILLPQTAAHAKRPARPLATGTGRCARIMLVDDDDAVRELLHDLLTQYGYPVVSMATAEEAMADSSDYDVLVTDVVLPGMTGPELAVAVRRTRRDLPVLFISGDTAHAVDARMLNARTGFLQKPFNAHTLVSRVEELLRSSQTIDR